MQQEVLTIRQNRPNGLKNRYSMPYVMENKVEVKTHVLIIANIRSRNKKSVFICSVNTPKLYTFTKLNNRLK